MGRDRDRRGDRDRDGRDQRSGMEEEQPSAPKSTSAKSIAAMLNKKIASDDAGKKSSAAMSIAEKLKARAAGGVADAVRRGLDAADAARGKEKGAGSGGQWERFDLTKANYEEESGRLAMTDKHRQSVLAAIDNDEEFISSTMDYDKYMKRDSRGGKGADDEHMDAMFAPPSQATHHGTSSAAKMPTAPVARTVEEEHEDDAPTVVVLDEDKKTGGAGGSWKDRVKAAKLAEEVVSRQELPPLSPLAPSLTLLLLSRPITIPACKQL